MQEGEDEPRYEISKMERLAHTDLVVTNWDDQCEAYRVYGDGVILGKEIDEAIKFEELDKKELAKKQLDSQRLTFV